MPPENQLAVPIGLGKSPPHRMVLLSEFGPDSDLLGTDEMTEGQKRNLTIERIVADPTFRFNLLQPPKPTGYSKPDAIWEVANKTRIGQLIVKHVETKSRFLKLLQLGIESPYPKLDEVAPMAGDFVNAKMLLLDTNASGFDDVRRARNATYIRLQVGAMLRSFQAGSVRRLLERSEIEFDLLSGSNHGGKCRFADPFGTRNESLFTCLDIDSVKDSISGKIIHLFGCKCGAQGGLGDQMSDRAGIAAFIGYTSAVKHSDNIAACDSILIEALARGLNVREAATHVRNSYKGEINRNYNESSTRNDALEDAVDLEEALLSLRVIPENADARLV